MTVKGDDECKRCCRRKTCFDPVSNSNPLLSPDRKQRRHLAVLRGRNGRIGWIAWYQPPIQTGRSVSGWYILLDAILVVLGGAAEQIAQLHPARLLGSVRRAEVTILAVSVCPPGVPAVLAWSCWNRDFCWLWLYTALYLSSAAQQLQLQATVFHSVPIRLIPTCYGSKGSPTWSDSSPSSRACQPILRACPETLSFTDTS